MSRTNKCDACGGVPCIGNVVEFTGYTFDNAKTMGYWKGYLCYGCIYDARKVLNILDEFKTNDYD